MFKRTMALGLAVVMMLSVFTGCGINDLGYLNLARELSKLKQFQFENNTSFEISEEAADDNYSVSLELSGEADIEDLDSIYMNLDLDFSINGLKTAGPINFVIDQNKVYVSKNLVLEMLTFDDMLNDEEESSEVIEDIYSNSLKDVEYIMLADLEEYYDVDYKENYDAMQEDAFSYITAAFKGFDSKVITKISGGYSMKLTPQSTVEFIKRLVSYMCDNRERVFDETVKYVEKLYSSTSFEDMTEEEKEELIAELKDSRQDFYDFLDEAELMLEQDILSEYEAMVDGSQIKQDIYKSGSSYVEESYAKIVYEGIEFINLSSKTTVTPAAVTKKSVEGGFITAEELEEIYNRTENMLNPAQTMSIQWYSDDYDTQIDITRKNGKTDWDSQPYTIVDNRVYLPLRYIGETFGEEVYWDNDARKAYVLRGDLRIDMTGIIVDSRTMVKVRDFEKLGYKINYTQDGTWSTAVIEKQSH